MQEESHFLFFAGWKLPHAVVNPLPSPRIQGQGNSELHDCPGAMRGIADLSLPKQAQTILMGIGSAVVHLRQLLQDIENWKQKTRQRVNNYLSQALSGQSFSGPGSIQ